MGQLVPIIFKINSLCNMGESVHEELLRLTITSNIFTETIAAQIKQLNIALDELSLPTSTLFVDNNQIDDDLLEYPNQLLGKSWRCVIGKGKVAEKLRSIEQENTFIFFDQERFLAWFEKVEPLLVTTNLDDPFNSSTVIRISGLSKGIWGPQLKILGIEEMMPGSPASRLPDDKEANANFRNTTTANLRLRPRAWEITDGDTQSRVAKAVRAKSARVIAACLVQQINDVDDGYSVTLRGSRRVDIPLAITAEDHSILPVLNDALYWAYAERAETRLKLLAESLCTELNEASTLMTGLRKFLPDALKQAQDSYGFVILERKDAFHKEMRDFMKDMKAQADQYASKVRDLISALTRDVVGVLVLVGFSFIGKFDISNLKNLVTGAPFEILCKVLAFYLLVSSLLLMVATYRDANLALKEINGWFKLLQSYVSSADFTDRVISPLQTRRKFLWVMMWVVGMLYASVIIFVWKLPTLVPILMEWKN